MSSVLDIIQALIDVRRHASIVAVGKPVIAKVADVSSRGWAYVGVREYTSLNPTVVPNRVVQYSSMFSVSDLTCYCSWTQIEVLCRVYRDCFCAKRSHNGGRYHSLCNVHLYAFHGSKYDAELFPLQRLYVRDWFASVVRKLTYIVSGLQILTQIMIADITTLTWRGLVVSLVSAPFLVNAFIGSNISTAVIEHLGWRWGCKHVH